jgi:hypothetical protein
MFWDVTQCSLIEVSDHFGGTYFLHLQNVSKTRNQELHHTKKTTPTRWWRKRRAAGANVASTAG